MLGDVRGRAMVKVRGGNAGIFIPVLVSGTVNTTATARESRDSSPRESSGCRNVAWFHLSDGDGPPYGAFVITETHRPLEPPT
jgi:hypothetical protein